MKKQILAYRREIIELSSSKKYHSHHQNSKSEGRRVPRLDLSKLHRDSEIGDPNHPEDDSCTSLHEQLHMDGEGVVDGKNVTYQQYLKFLENEGHFDDTNNLNKK